MSKCECVEIHGIPTFDENFRDDRGFSIYELSLYGERSATPLRWDTITPESNFEQALEYAATVASEWLADGTMDHYCGIEA